MNQSCSPQQPQTLTLDLGDRSYNIVVGHGLLDTAGEAIRPLLKQPRVAIVTDSNVAPLWLDKLTASLEAADIRYDAFTLPAGESTKSFAHLQELCETLLAARIERGTTLIALGGGVIGDLTGFAAAITLRGLNFIQIPTTVLSQVDSSVGGKTGINTKQGKNLVGAFHQPRHVLIDIETLTTLPRRELLAGYAEVVKYGLINDPDFFSWLEDNGEALIDGNADLCIKAILHACRAKADVVAQDEKEAGLRALLNLGHTFGHALEAECGYGGKILHGEAVAIGMCMAFDLSVDLGLCPQEDADRVRAHLKAVGLATDIAAIKQDGWTADKLIGHMAQDKKVKDGKVTFVMARGIGQSFLTGDVDAGALKALMERYLCA